MGPDGPFPALALPWPLEQSAAGNKATKGCEKEQFVQKKGLGA